MSLGGNVIADAYTTPGERCKLMRAYAAMTAENVINGTVADYSIAIARRLDGIDKLRLANLIIAPEGVTPVIDSTECGRCQSKRTFPGSTACRGRIRWLQVNQEGQVIDRFPPEAQLR
jgi:hypothetical protein